MGAMISLNDDRNDSAAAPYPSLNELETFGVPFLCYARDCRRVYVSSAAEALLRVKPRGASLGVRSDQAVINLKWSNIGDSTDGFVLVREVPAWANGVVLAVYVAKSPGAPSIAVVVIRPTSVASGDLLDATGFTPGAFQKLAVRDNSGVGARFTRPLGAARHAFPADLQ